MVPEIVIASENLIENLQVLGNTVITDGVVYQQRANPWGAWKLIFFFNNTQHITTSTSGHISYEVGFNFYRQESGFISYTFTTPDELEDFDQIKFGINGSMEDTVVTFDIKDMMPSTTYTLQWRLLNNLPGEIAWTDMLLVRCADGYSLIRGEENCSRTCAAETITGGHIPPDVARVYEPAICTYTPSNFICDDGYVKIGDACEQICTAGITRLHAGDVATRLYARKIGSPALHVRYNNSICYGRLVTGHGTGLNIKIDGTIYHLID